MQLPTSTNAKLMFQVLVEKERSLFRSRPPEKMTGSCLQNHLSISGTLAGLYRGTVGREALRKF